MGSRMQDILRRRRDLTMKNRLTFVILLLVVLALVAPVAAQDAITFTFGSEANPVQLDSAVVTDGPSFRVLRQGCEGLMAFTPGTTTPEPSLATDFTVSEDGMTWVFNLVEGATFHDGSPFNAEAVVWNFDRWRLTGHPAHFAEEIFEYYEAQFGGFDDASLITSVEATGEYQVTFTLSAPIGAFLNNLAMAMFAIHSPATIEANGANYGSPEVGYSCTGPYRFVSWTSDVEVVLERNADYYGENPSNIDQIVFRVITDNAARLAALQAGEIDGFERPNVEDIETITSSEDLQLVIRPSFNVLYLAFNYRIAEFRDPLVRRALSLAINRQEIVDAFYLPGSVAANTFHPPSIGIGFNADIQTPYDPEQSMALLAEAGYPDGLSEVNVLGVDDAGNVTEEIVETIPLRLFYMPVTRPYNPDPEAIGEAMQTYLADAGFSVELTTAGDWATYLDDRANGRLLGMYQLGWTGDNGDPDNFIGYFFANVDAPLAREGFYQNEALAALLQEARGLTDPTVRDGLYKQAEALVAEGADRLFIAHGPVPLAFSSRVTGYVASPLGDEPFSLITIVNE